MSYILDALKRAEAERGRGGVPHVHSPGVPLAAAPPARNVAATWIAALAIVAVLAAAGVWRTFARQAPHASASPSGPPSASSLGPISAQAPVLPSPSVNPAEAPQAVASAAVQMPPPPPALPTWPPAATPAAAGPTPAATPSTAASATQRKVAEAPRASASRPTAAAAASPVSAAPLATVAPVVPVAPSPPPSPVVDDPIYAVAELPADIRAQLPALTITGATYSAQPAYRMLIANGQVLHEADSPAPGVTLEAIRQKDVVLRFRGYRYRVGF